MKTLQPDTFLLPITMFVTLSSVIAATTLATIIQMDKDLIADESTTQLAGPSHSDRHFIFVAQHAHEQ